MTVPSGGAAVSGDNSGGGATTATVPAANYFPTAAGGVSGLLAELQSQLNSSRPTQGYPATAAEMAKVVGWGTWTAGYLLDEASGNAAAAFGGPTLNQGGPTYQQPGARASGVDYSVKFGAESSYFQAPANTDFDISGTEDVAFLWVGKFAAINTGEFTRICVKSTFGGGGGAYQLAINTPSHLHLEISDGTDLITPSAGAGSVVADQWHVGIAVLERGTNKARVGIRYLTSGSAFVSSEVDATAIGSLASAAQFALGSYSDASWNCAAFYVAEGSGAATGLSANLSTALSNFAAAVNGAWSVSLDHATGKATINCTEAPTATSPSFALRFTNTTLRDLLGFTGNLDYPTTAAEVASVIGFGTWTAGYLCNEASGNLASVFGSPATLTATSLVYGAKGPRGGSDQTIGFDATTDNANGGDVIDVKLGDDLCVAWVGYISAAAASSRDMFTKVGSGPGPGFGIWEDGPNSRLTITNFLNAGNRNDAHTTAIPTGEWHVGIAVIDRAAAKIRIGTRGLRTGTVTTGSEVAASQWDLSSSASFIVGGAGGAWTGNGVNTNLKLAAFYIGAGRGAAAGMSTNLSTALANFAASFGAWTGTKQCRAVWYPDCTLDLEGHPARAPKVSDLRTTQSPTGIVLGLSGNTFYRHRDVGWSHVPIARAWEEEAATDNASWEYFFKETQLGLGAPWFTPSSPVQIYDHAGVRLGVDANLAGWWITGIDAVEPVPPENDGSTAFWTIRIPELVSSG